jgi:transaldolase
VTVPSVDRLRTRVFADGADVESLLALAAEPYVQGFTTNPTLMRKAGVADYRAFAREVLDQITDRPISFEVFSDEPAEMRDQALEIASWGPNVYVKIPVTNTRGVPMTQVVADLSRSGVQVNVTALMTERQVEMVAEALAGGAPSCVSVFAGRVADTGRDPLPIMCGALRVLASVPSAELIWASPREVLNVLQADSIGCHIITVTYDLLGKLKLLGKDLDEFSLDTVRMFHEDARRAGYSLKPVLPRA